MFAKLVCNTVMRHITISCLTLFQQDSAKQYKCKPFSCNAGRWVTGQPAAKSQANLWKLCSGSICWMLTTALLDCSAY